MVGACGEPLPGDEINVTRSALDGRLTDDLEQKSIILTALPIVENVGRTADPCLPLTKLAGAASKKWTMGYLLTQASSSSPTPTTASNFVKRWMSTWTEPLDGKVHMDGKLYPKVNGEIVEPNAEPGNKSTGQILNEAWQTNSGSKTTYKMDYAPFRLLAIVPRFDLRKRRRNGEGLAGELRFVFGAVDNNKAHGCSTIGENTVILEYAVDRATENDVVAWAKSWLALANETLGSTTYLNKLDGLVQGVIQAGKGSGYKGRDEQPRPNGSELIRIRTNEKRGSMFAWHLREWEIVSDSRYNPNPATVKQTPSRVYKTPQDSTVGNWANDNAYEILHDTYTVPTTTTPKLGGKDVNATEGDEPSGVWDVGFDDNEVRHAFAMNTCEGCHHTETDNIALHIETRDPGKDSLLSSFLTGVFEDGRPFSVQDTRGTKRYFHEAADRAADLRNLASGYYTVPLPEGIPSTALATYFKLVNNNSKCLDMGGSSAGVLAQQWSCGGGGNQRFTAISLGGGYYTIRVKQGNYCLQAEANNTVTQRACSSYVDQVATITSVLGLPYYEIKFFSTNKCLELPDSNNGTKARQSTCDTGTGRQMFSFVE
ncbi:MAG: RICIN domain-containing protein [Polyangia bacterium]